MTKPASRTSAARPAAKPASAKTASAKPRAAKPASAPQPAATLAARPATLRLAAAAHLVEAIGMVVATGFSAAATASGKSYETSSGIALTTLAFIGALAFAAVAAGIARAKPWSRTPAVMCQFFVVIAGVLLLDGHRYYWGIPAFLLVAAALAGLFAPASIKALNRS
jgi:hypothetical protein